MGSSTKRKREKKKDFQKPKLKVGKAKPKASNITDTNFKARSIVLNQQSLTTTAPTPASQFTHHLSMLSHKSETQRKESLSFLTAAVHARLEDDPLPQPISVIISKTQSLVLDGSNAVRSQLLKFLESLPPAQVCRYTERLLLYVRAGMTHLSTDIRFSSLDIFNWLLRVAPDDVVSCPGGWVRTIKCFTSLLGWQSEVQNLKWTVAKGTFGKAAGESKLFVKQLRSFGSFLQAGLKENASLNYSQQDCFPLWHVSNHVLPTRSNVFAHLNLFGQPTDEETAMYEDHVDRQQVFARIAQNCADAGIEQARKAGGEVGRAAIELKKVLEVGMSDAANS